ncbi:MAG: hypothetical protein WDW36_009314 [Sanguina aurantia]
MHRGIRPASNQGARLQSVRTHAKAPGGKAAPAPPPPAQGGGKPAPAAPKRKEIIPEVMEPEMEDENEEFGEGEYDPVDDLPAPQRRRVLALKDIQAQYDEASKDYLKKLAVLQQEFNELNTPLYDSRRAVILGTAAVGNMGVEDDGTPDEGIPEFWLNSFANHNKVGQFITERDAEVLRCLEDVRVSVNTGEERGFTLSFHFGENPFFAEQTLSKTYILEPEEEVVPKKFTGTAISWKEGKDVTVEVVKKRVKAPKGGKAAAKAFVSETVPCDSFFNFFDPPVIPDDTESLSNNELDELQEELSRDFELGYAIKDNIIPRADEDYDEFEEGEEEEGPGQGGGRY